MLEHNYGQGAYRSGYAYKGAHGAYGAKGAGHAQAGGESLPGLEPYDKQAAADLSAYQMR